MTEALIGTIPQSWESTTLAQLCARGGGGIQTGPFGSQLHASDYVSSGIPSVMPKDIGENVILENSIARVSPQDAQRLSKYLLAKGDIVYSRRGDVERRALVRNEQEGWLCGTGCLRVRPGSSVNSKFLSYYLGHPAVRKWIVQHAVGATMPNLNTDILGNVPIIVPPRAIQEEIANILGTLDDKIRVNERIIILYENILQTQFDHMTSAAKSSSTEMPVSDLVEFNPKTGKPTEQEAVYVDMAALPTESSPISTWSHRPPKSGSRFMNGDTLLARITPCLENGKTGYVDFMNDGQIGTGSTEFIVMRSRPGIPDEFSYFLARNKRFRAHAIQKMAGTSGRQRVNAADASNFFIQKPTDKEIQKFGDQSSKAFSHMKYLVSESRILTELRDTLLPQLMSGKLRVKDAERIVEDNV